MALFQQKPEEQKQDWAGLPSEPLDPENPAETLPEAPAVDPSTLTLGGETTSLVFPVAAPPSEESDAASAAPDAPAHG